MKVHNLIRSAACPALNVTASAQMFHPDDGWSGRTRLSRRSLLSQSVTSYVHKTRERARGGRVRILMMLRSGTRRRRVLRLRVTGCDGGVTSRPGAGLQLVWEQERRIGFQGSSGILFRDSESNIFNLPLSLPHLLAHECECFAVTLTGPWSPSRSWSGLSWTGSGS